MSFAVKLVKVLAPVLALQRGAAAVRVGDDASDASLSNSTEGSKRAPTCCCASAKSMQDDQQRSIHSAASCGDENMYLMVAAFEYMPRKNEKGNLEVPVTHKYCCKPLPKCHAHPAGFTPMTDFVNMARINMNMKETNKYFKPLRDLFLTDINPSSYSAETCDSVPEGSPGAVTPQAPGMFADFSKRKFKGGVSSSDSPSDSGA